MTRGGESTCILLSNGVPTLALSRSGYSGVISANHLGTPRHLHKKSMTLDKICQLSIFRDRRLFMGHATVIHIEIGVENSLALSA